MYQLKRTFFSFRILTLTGLVLLLVGGGLFWFTQEAEGVTRTWDCGGGDSSWNNDLNWTGDTEPGASDIASFDATCTNNVTIDKSISVAGINIAAGYTGTITQSSTYAIVVGTSWVQAGGTFAGGSGNIVTPILTLTGGNFTSTSGYLYINESTNNVDVTVLTFSNANFVHNNGTVYFLFTGGWTGTNHTVSIQNALSFYNLSFNYVNNYSTSWGYVVSGAGSISVQGTLSHIDGELLGGTLNLYGNLIVGPNPSNTNNANNGALLNFVGAINQTYSYSGGRSGRMTINKSSGSVSPAGGTTALAIGKFTLTAGEFVAPTGTLDIWDWQDASATVFKKTGGTFTHSNGLVFCQKYTDGAGWGERINYIDGAIRFYNLTLSSNLGDGPSGHTIVTGQVIVEKNLTISSGFLRTGSGGSIEIQGNYTVGSGADGGTAPITLNGTGDQTYTDQGGNEPDGDITINKSAGAVTLASNADWNASGQDLTLTAGLLIVPSTYNISTTNLTVGASGTLQWSGTGDLTLAGNVSNAGTIKMRSTTCGQDDLVLIRSSDGVTQRTWSGAGTFQMYDVNVEDQAGSASITAYSSTNNGGNGGNWTFSGAACPNIPAAFGLPSGIINLGSGVINLR